ncbi:hypothetical protein JZ751_028393 [Albula glossodonta]|uniref:Transmembrane protein 186 n=1 Tax=Albula glossodonta TaxID=121402 RepID=A0A8T2NBA3_9TELE|nr:hypothetical protein JZ751_028393 [Albula glossodonta]
MLLLALVPSSALGCRGHLVLRHCRKLLTGARPLPHGASRALPRKIAPISHCRMVSTVPHNQTQLKPDDPASHKFTLIYSFPAIRMLRVVSRLKLLQTGITLLLLPPVHYFYFHGQASYDLMCYSTGIAVFAAIMLYSLSHYLRRVVGMMYLDNSKTTLKVSHLTFWGHRRDVYMPVTDIMTLGDTGDTRTEPLLRLKRYSCPDTLYFSTRLGRVVDKQAFELVFGRFP